MKIFDKTSHQVRCEVPIMMQVRCEVPIMIQVRCEVLIMIQSQYLNAYVRWCQLSWPRILYATVVTNSPPRPVQHTICTKMHASQVSSGCRVWIHAQTCGQYLYADYIIQHQSQHLVLHTTSQQTSLDCFHVLTCPTRIDPPATCCPRVCSAVISVLYNVTKSDNSTM